MNGKNEINAVFENGIVKLLYTSLPVEFYKKDIAAWSFYIDYILYQSENFKINSEVLKTNMKTMEKKVNSDFKDYNLNFSFNENFGKNIYINNCSDISSLGMFILANKDINIVINISSYAELIEILKDESFPNLSIIIPDSDEQIPYNEFYNMYNVLDEIVKLVNHYNLSPLEKVLFIYDIVKSNEYKKENKNENYRESRNLNRIVTGDKIVCKGFTNLMDYLLKSLEFKCDMVTLAYTNKKTKHTRNMLYLKDDKYDIDGIFFLDATWDSKKNENYLDNYNYFLKPLKFFSNNKNEFVIGNEEFDILTMNDDEIRKYISDDKEFYFSNIANSLFLLNFDKDETIFYELTNMPEEELFNKTKQMNIKYNQEIPKEAFKNALYRVRKIQYINNIFKCNLSEEYINQVCSRYYVDSAEVKLLKAIGIHKEPTLNKEIKASNADSVKQDSLRMQFLKLLKQQINDFPQNDFIKKM